MLVLVINTDEYRLHADFKKYQKLKHELLSRYRETDEVVIYDKGKEVDRNELGVYFNK